MASIASPLVQRRKEPDEEQLLKLFWNRAELKKELAKLRRERDKLVEQLRQQEGVNLRSQQRLEQLENLLADPLQAANAAVYYQLRGVWQQCRKRLARLARELRDRQQDHEEQHARGLFEQARDAVLAGIDAQLAELAARERDVESDLRAVEERTRQLRGFWNYLRRRAAADQAEAVRAALEGLQAQSARLRAERREKEAEPCPPFTGLSLEGRRNINLAVIAMAQELVVHLADGNVAGLARDAAVRSLSDVSYGTVAECRAQGQAIDTVVRRLDGMARLAAQVRRRAEFLRKAAQYRRDSDTVPMAASFGEIPLAIADAGEARPEGQRSLQVNVLADEYWEIYGVLLN
jgi:hypothetical protein